MTSKPKSLIGWYNLPNGLFEIQPKIDSLVINQLSVYYNPHTIVITHISPYKKQSFYIK